MSGAIYLVDPSRVNRWGFLNPRFTDAERNALASASAFTPDRVGRIVLAHVDAPEWTWPFSSFRKYADCMRWRGEMRKRMALSPDEVRARLAAEANAHGDQLTLELNSLLAQERWDSRARDMLSYGIALGLAGLAAGLAIGTAIGGAAGPYGACVGAVVGACVGITMGVIPWGRYELRKNWNAVLDAQLPVERYASLSQFRRLSDVAREKRGSLGPWRWSDDALYTVFGDADQGLEWLMQDTLARDCLPEPTRNKDAPAFRFDGDRTAQITAFQTLDPVARYGIGALCGHVNDNVKIGDCEAAKVTMGSFGGFGHLGEAFGVVPRAGNAWLAPTLDRFREMTAGEVRKALVDGTPSMPDCDSIPITGDIVWSVNEYNRAHAA